MSYDDVDDLYLRNIFEAALLSANAAGAEWLQNAKPRFAVFNTDLFGNKDSSEPIDVMLDNCGNAYIEILDKRTKFYKLLKKNHLLKYKDGKTIDIRHDYQNRQEHSLHIVICAAFLKVLESNGFTGLRLKHYID